MRKNKRRICFLVCLITCIFVCTYCFISAKQPIKSLSQAQKINSQQATISHKENSASQTEDKSTQVSSSVSDFSSSFFNVQAACWQKKSSFYLYEADIDGDITKNIEAILHTYQDKGLSCLQGQWADMSGNVWCAVMYNTSFSDVVCIHINAKDVRKTHISIKRIYACEKENT